MEEQNTLAYDLRQIYANEIVGTHLKLCTQHRINGNYQEYFKSLENLYTVVRHKFKGKKDKDLEDDEEEKKNKTDLEIYKEIRTKAINVCNKYRHVYLNESPGTNDEVGEVESALREIEQYLYKVMDKANMFGSQASNRGL